MPKLSVAEAVNAHDASVSLTGPRCFAQRIASQLDGANRANFLQMLEPGSGLSHAAIADILVALERAGTIDRAPTASSVGRHRKGRCRCP